jgi:hypothetical protein
MENEIVRRFVKGEVYDEKVRIRDFVGDFEGWLRNSYENFHFYLNLKITFEKVKLNWVQKLKKFGNLYII